MVSVKRIKPNIIFYEYKHEDIVIQFNSAYSLFLTNKTKNRLNTDEYPIRRNQDINGNMNKKSKGDDSNVLTK